MYISGTLHLYSGEDREMFFVFDDSVAKQLYEIRAFDIDDLNSRRAYISVGLARFIHRRTLSFSKKQTEVKVSLCSRGSKDGLRTLTALYDWYAAPSRSRPTPFPIIGSLEQVTHKAKRVWELRLTEPVGFVVPPGLTRRTKKKSPERRSFENRRKIVGRDLEASGRAAEELALILARGRFPSPNFGCFWRREYLDSERIEIRKMGVIADIDIWDFAKNVPKQFIEVKAQKVISSGSSPVFHLSAGEWRSYRVALKSRIPYVIWLFQYQNLSDFRQARHSIELVVFNKVDERCLLPDSYLVTPEEASAVRVKVKS